LNIITDDRGVYCRITLRFGSWNMIISNSNEEIGIFMIKKISYKLLFLSAIIILHLANCGSDDPVSSKTVPVLSTTTVTKITETTAQSGGTITSEGGATVTVRGVCWSTNVSPTVADYTTTNAAGIGSFISSLTGLTGGTIYYVRAYAINSIGTGYGNVESFTSLDPETGTVTDIDGNVYRTITIGAQEWMVENLKVIHYRNGDAIPNVTDNMVWGGLSTGAYCEYENNIGNVSTYGRLYNWYSVADNRKIAPTGWHVPTDDEWKQLEIYLGMTVADQTGWRGIDEGGKLKEMGTIHWSSPNTGATNEVGFMALPSGFRDYNDGTFSAVSLFTSFWSSEESESLYAWHRSLNFNTSVIYHGGGHKRYGYSIRCVKD
jgi:uncharacterized protein (TIGR02145 family)